MMYEKKITRILSAVLLFIVTVSLFAPSASAAYYEDSFPYTETGLTGGAYVECSSSLGDIVLLLPPQYRFDSITFTTDFNLCNVTSSSISCLIFLNGNQYTARFPAFGTLEYRASSSTGYYDYLPVTVHEVKDTNVVFFSASSEFNGNFYFSYYEMAVLSLLIMILFFVFLGWFLLHRKV